MMITQEQMERAVGKALDADACAQHMGDVWSAARNYMFGCDPCRAKFAEIARLALAPKKQVKRR